MTDFEKEAKAAEAHILAIRELQWNGCKCGPKDCFRCENVHHTEQRWLAVKKENGDQDVIDCRSRNQEPNWTIEFQRKRYLIFRDINTPKGIRKGFVGTFLKEDDAKLVVELVNARNKVTA